MTALIDHLHATGCSLVVKDAQGQVTSYHKKGVRDLMWLLDHEPQRLKGALVADKVVGKAAAGLLAQGGARQVYATVMSRHAAAVLEKAGIAHACGTMVDSIVIPDGDDRCPLEQIVFQAATPQEIEQTLREHFAHMAAQKT